VGGGGGGGDDEADEEDDDDEEAEEDSVHREASCYTEEEYSELKLDIMVFQCKITYPIAEQTLTKEQSNSSTFKRQEVVFPLWHLCLVLRC
jgi:hypothetical protein